MCERFTKTALSPRFLTWKMKTYHPPPRMTVETKWIKM